METLCLLEACHINGIWDPKSAYDLAAGGYDEWPWQKVWRSVESRDIDDLLRGREIGAVLDVGCGTGTLLKKLGTLTDKRAELVGLDISAGMLEQARLKNIGMPIRLIEDNLLRCSLQENYFDFVFMCRVASHLSDLKPYFEKIATLLKPEGIFALSDVHIDYPYECTRLPFKGRRIRVATYKHAPQEIVAFAEKSSLELVAFKTYGPDTLSSDLRDDTELPASLREVVVKGASTKFGFFVAFRRCQVQKAGHS